MGPDFNLILFRLLFAFLTGGIIGIEWAFHGREAGFRSYSLVSVAFFLLIYLMTYEGHLSRNKILLRIARISLKEQGKEFKLKLTLLAEQWQPYRTIVCNYLWSWKSASYTK